MATTFNSYAMACIGFDEVRRVNVVDFINATLSLKNRQEPYNHQAIKFDAKERSKNVCF